MYKRQDFRTNRNGLAHAAAVSRLDADHAGAVVAGFDGGNGAAGRSRVDGVVALLTGGIHLATATVSTYVDLVLAEVDVAVGGGIRGQNREDDLLVLVTRNRSHQQDVRLVVAVLGEVDAFRLLLDLIGPAVLRFWSALATASKPVVP